ncbi:MAG TPA: hypothetical protein VFC65_09395 [Prolixibacteraceae bacterium]|nr:hypothetical protein [Prolixibacteraceae bacterium]
MSDKFQDRYRIPSARAGWWNYGWSGAYFVTICTAHREHYFGEITDGNDDGETGRNVETGHCPVSTKPINDPKPIDTTNPHHSSNIDIQPVMQLSKIGQLAEKFWRTIPQHFSFVKLDAFVVMPNHIHGILIIDKPDDGCDNSGNGDNGRIDVVDEINGIDVDVTGDVETGHCPVSTNQNQNQNINSTTEPQTPGELRFRNQGKGTLSSIVGSYKSIVTKYAHQIHADFEWQERFHDRIIRDEEEFYQIANYIESNVSNWQNDKFYN